MNSLSVEKVFRILQPTIFFRGHVTQFDSISDCSSKAGPGVLFFAREIHNQSPEKFLDITLMKGAPGIVTHPHLATEKQAVFSHVTFFGVPHVRLALAHMAGALYPERPDFLSAVTGTNGKTSIAHFTYQLWQLLGINAGCLGTLGIRGPTVEDTSFPLSALTTPSSLFICPLIHHWSKMGIKHCILEASSHGLDQKRLDGLRFHASVFSSFSHDHLDYHRNIRSYWLAKTHLFKVLAKTGGHAILNTSLPYFYETVQLCRQRGLTTWRYGREDTADVAIKTIDADTRTYAQKITLSFFGKIHTFTVPFIGHFVAENIVAAILLVHASGQPLEKILSVTQKLTPPEGRLMYVGSTQNHARIYVDYAHTPDALQQALQALRPYAKRKLGVVFGCGGERDQDKRSVMGQIARKNADFVIVTDDNPRQENASLIRRAILEEVPNATEIPERADAIREGIMQLKRGDLLLIAGKGHENVQHKGSDIVPFSDIRFAQKVLKENAVVHKKSL